MRLKQKITIAIISLTFATPNLFASGYPVFDVSGWLTALDQLYQQYDMVINSITTIENQYMQIQHAVERAKSITGIISGSTAISTSETT